MGGARTKGKTMTENDGSTLRPEARDDVMFDLRGVAELLELEG